MATRIIALSLASVLNYIIIPLIFVVFVFSIIKLFKNKNRIVKEEEDEDGIK